MKLAEKLGSSKFSLDVSLDISCFDVAYEVLVTNSVFALDLHSGKSCLHKVHQVVARN